MIKMPFNKGISSDNSAYYIDVIRLIRSNNVGSVIFFKAISQFGSVSAALAALNDDPMALGRKVTLIDKDLAEKEYHQGIKSGAKPIAFNDPEFPALMAQIYDCPPIIWTKGRFDILKTYKCAIVGARNASVGGRKIAYSLAKNLGLNNFTTVSGLASGIDTAAHQGALNSGTIGVLASGVNVIYPNENEKLAQEMLDHGGLILSEAPPNAPPQAKMFIKRNRIISALSLGTVIIEAAEKSGSLSTAEFAIEQNRDVFAVPGSPLDARAAGTNKLLRNGAYWAENSDDVIKVLQEITKHQALNQNHQMRTNKQNYLHKPNAKEITIEPIIVTPQIKTQKASISDSEKILELLSTTPIACDDLTRLTGINSSKLVSLLSMMELNGDITRHTGNMISKTIKRA